MSCVTKNLNLKCIFFFFAFNVSFPFFFVEKILKISTLTLLASLNVFIYFPPLYCVAFLHIDGDQILFFNVVTTSLFKVSL